MSKYAIGYLVTRLSMALALLVLILGVAGAVLAWSVFSGKIDAARVPADSGLNEAIESINAAQRGAIEELRTAGLPVSRNELLVPARFGGEESIATLDRRLDLLAEARDVVLGNQREVVAKVSVGFDELIGQLNELARRTTAAAPPAEAIPEPETSSEAALLDSGESVPPLFTAQTGGDDFRRRVQALDAAKVALLSLMTEVQKPENRERIRATMDEISNLELLISRAMQEEVDRTPDQEEDEIALRTGSGRAMQIASVLEKRKVGVVAAVLGDWSVLQRIDGLARKLENRRQQLEASEVEMTNLAFQRNMVSLGLVAIGVIFAIVLGAAGDVARAILDCARYLGNM